MGELFRDLLEMDGWRFAECKIKSKRDTNCWISPDGKWYNVGVCNHTVFAYYVMKETHPRSDNDMMHFLTEDFENAGKELLGLGWIYVEDTFATGTIVRGYQNMTEKQYRVLLQTFGNRPLFRGWTIKAMWLAKEDMKQEAKED